MLPIRRPLAYALAIVVAGPALAEAPPYGGAVYNLDLNERINYSCTKLTETDVECSFTSATVSQVLPADKLAERRAEELAGIDAPGAVEELAVGMCEAVQRLDQAIANGDTAELDAMPEADRETLLRSFRSICEKRDRASIEALIDFSLDVSARTCMVSTLSWKGRFSRNDEKTWVRTDADGPVGDGCGGVYLDRFELSDMGTFWNLVRLAVASNPKGTFTTGEQCSEIYTGQETQYRWQGGDLPASCDYIRLNLFN